MGMLETKCARRQVGERARTTMGNNQFSSPGSYLIDDAQSHGVTLEGLHGALEGSHAVDLHLQDEENIGVKQVGPPRNTYRPISQYSSIDDARYPAHSVIM